MSEEIELVVYTRSTFCPYQAKANRVFEKYGLNPRTIYIDKDPEAEKLVIEWTGFRSVPTIILARKGEDLPIEAPAPLTPGSSPCGVDRGSMITEAGEIELKKWLKRNGFID